MASKVLLLARLRPVLVNKKSFSTTVTRNAHGPPGSPMYRFNVPPVTYGARIQIREALQILFWFNILYSFWYQPELALAHPLYTCPKPELWTDEELGIPPDDYDEEVEAGNAYYVRSA